MRTGPGGRGVSSNTSQSGEQNSRVVPGGPFFGLLMQTYANYYILMCTGFGAPFAAVWSPCSAGKEGSH